MYCQFNHTAVVDVLHPLHALENLLLNPITIENEVVDAKPVVKDIIELYVG
jgi:hypothetical protein